MKSPTKAPRNRTITISDEDREILSSELRSDCSILEGVVKGDSFELSKKLPTKCVDLLVLDPPYNLTKTFGKESFSSRSPEKYQCWIESYLKIIMPALKPTASIYVCGDWLSSASLFPALDKYFKVRNRITWEREKGRGSKTNWKNCSEDIWYCTMGDEFKFYPERVRLRRKVLAPYKDSEGKPKDWVNKAGKKYRDTAPSNLWSDITIPFWSMPENTNHPTQKPEKLIAKLILSSSDEKVFISCFISKNLIAERNLNASNIIKQLAPIIDGSGGGQPFFATGGGKNINAIDKALTESEKIINQL